MAEAAESGEKLKSKSADELLSHALVRINMNAYAYACTYTYTLILESKSADDTTEQECR